MAPIFLANDPAAACCFAMDSGVAPRLCGTVPAAFFLEGTMLVITRKTHEGVVCKGPCRVVVLEIRSDRVRLGFEADRGVTIHRDEIAAVIDREKEKP